MQKVYIMIAILLSIYLIWYVFRSPRHTGKVHRIIIPIEDIAHHWRNPENNSGIVVRDMSIPVKLPDPSLQQTDIAESAGVPPSDENSSGMAESKEKLNIYEPPSSNAGGEWRNGCLNDFWKELVESNPVIMDSEGYVLAIRTLLSFYDEAGDTPSIVNLETDKEFNQRESHYTVYEKIPLWEHSLNVARKILEIYIGIGGSDYRIAAGKLIVVALGHDIGKIPALLYNSVYATGDHRLTSALVLESIFTEVKLDIKLKTDMVSAVRDHHHKSPNGGLLDLLMKADSAARIIEKTRVAMIFPLLVKAADEAEKAKTRKNAAPASKPIGIKSALKRQLVDVSWIDKKVLIERIFEHVNVVNKGLFKAFSMRDGYVYVHPRLLSDIVFDMADDMRYSDIVFNKTSKSYVESLQASIQELLRKDGFIPDFISKDNIGTRFDMLDDAGNKLTTGWFIPIQAHAFGMSVGEIEERKGTQKRLLIYKTLRPASSGT
jgi:hypothetical protein